MRVLHILNGLNNGGVESFLLNLSEALEQSDIKMDFLLRSDKNDIEKIRYFEDKDSNIFYLPPFPRSIVKNYLELKKFLKEKENCYDIIHIHANSLVYFSPIRLSCQLCSKSKVIIHSHNTKGFSLMSTVMNKINRHRLTKLPVTRLACSEKAGQWMFEKEFEVLPNSIDVNSYRTTSEEKNNLRKKYGINGKKLIVFVGRLEAQKNPLFLLPIMKNLCDISPKVHLVYAGEGSMRNKLKEEIYKIGLSNNIHLLGNVNKVSLLLKIADIFVMPSIFEGLGIAAIEAQCSGIPAIMSDHIPEETILCKNAFRLELDEKLWEKGIINLLENDQFDENNFYIIEKSGYGLSSLGEKISKIYKDE